MDDNPRIVAEVAVTEAEAKALAYAIDDYIKAGDYEGDEYTFWNLTTLLEKIEWKRICDGLIYTFSPETDATKA